MILAWILRFWLIRCLMTTLSTKRLSFCKQPTLSGLALDLLFMNWGNVDWKGVRFGKDQTSQMTP